MGSLSLETVFLAIENLQLESNSWGRGDGAFISATGQVLGRVLSGVREGDPTFFLTLWRAGRGEGEAGCRSEGNRGGRSWSGGPGSHSDREAQEDVGTGDEGRPWGADEIQDHLAVGPACSRRLRDHGSL